MAGEDGESSNGNVGCIDIISGLPDEIRECILGYLPIPDAVRTSVLSHKWRYSWTRATRLNIRLDTHMENNINIRSDMYCGLVGRILLYHVGPIHTFVVRVTWRDREEDMNSWLQFVSRNGIQDLRLLCDKEFDGFDLPQSIFQCRGLSCLTLDKINLKYSLPFRGFSNLVRLVLYDLDVYGDVLEKIISSSLTLEVLIIEMCSFLAGGRSDTTAITAPNLRVLRVVCYSDGLGYIYLKHTPSLRVGSFTIEDFDDLDFLQSNCFDVLRSMPKIEVLTFDCFLHKTSSSDVILKRLPELLVNLKTVTLDMVDVIYVDTISFMFCIIRSSPNLQTLKIHLRSYFMGELSFSKDSLIAARLYLDAVDKEEIKASVTKLSVSIGDDNNEEYIGARIALVGSIVSCCPTLGKLFIKISPSLKGPVKLMLSNILRHYGRSSSELKIIFRH